MTFISIQVALTMLVGLLGLIALIVARHTRRREQRQPQLSPALARVVQKPVSPCDFDAILAARHRRSSPYRLKPQAVGLREPSSETWGSVQATAGDADDGHDQALATSDPAHDFAERVKRLAVDHPDVAQYLQVQCPPAGGVRKIMR